jgi:dipeptidyl aminopeptidase/acylaminoacyl peptidase
VVPVNQSHLLCEALQAVEADVTFKRFSNVDHNFGVDTPAWREAQYLALAFFTEHLR